MSQRTRRRQVIPIIPIMPSIPGASYSIPNFMHRQREMNNWCWAATTEMVMATTSAGSRPQCYYVEQKFVNLQSKCCAALRPIACDQTCSTNDIDQVYVQNGLTSVAFHRRPLRMRGTNSIEAELRANKPVLVGWVHKTTQFGHLVLVYGFSVVNGTECVRICDPAFNHSQTITYAELGSSVCGHLWVWTWTGLG